MSTTLTKMGSALAYLQDYSYDYDPQRGVIYHADFEGIDYPTLNAIANTYIGEGIAVKVRYHRGGKSSLSGDDSTQSFTIDSWEVAGSMERYDLINHPTIRAIGLSTTDIAKLKSALQNPSTTDDWSATYAKFTDKTHGATLQGFYNAACNGETHFEAEQYVLKHSTNVSNRWPGDAQVALMEQNTGAIYTIGTLLSEISNGAWFFPCPSRLLAKISGIVPGPAATGYQWGAKKQTTTETTEANNRTRIATEYVFAMANTALYPNVV